eukprot:TRINITY_DN37258_c0_g1_i1.p1 TRINITY_DN37258_c0_g1~~TRINITY_DN37258_c0_g1_i1.p1  ORF type:complete len:499 (-),score=96.06 TRINITY_DN37258_c0_g1_i1:382-1878(-)
MFHEAHMAFPYSYIRVVTIASLCLWPGPVGAERFKVDEDLDLYEHDGNVSAASSSSLLELALAPELDCQIVSCMIDAMVAPNAFKVKTFVEANRLHGMIAAAKAAAGDGPLDSFKDSSIIGPIVGLVVNALKTEAHRCQGTSGSCGGVAALALVVICLVGILLFIVAHIPILAGAAVAAAGASALPVASFLSGAVGAFFVHVWPLICQDAPADSGSKAALDNAAQQMVSEVPQTDEQGNSRISTAINAGKVSGWLRDLKDKIQSGKSGRGGESPGSWFGAMMSGIGGMSTEADVDAWCINLKAAFGDASIAIQGEKEIELVTGRTLAYERAGDPATDRLRSFKDNVVAVAAENLVLKLQGDGRKEEAEALNSKSFRYTLSSLFSGLEYANSNDWETWQVLEIMLSETCPRFTIKFPHFKDNMECKKPIWDFIQRWKVPGSSNNPNQWGKWKPRGPPKSQAPVEEADDDFDADIPDEVADERAGGVHHMLGAANIVTIS